jgi:hypothetical protein
MTSYFHHKLKMFGKTIMEKRGRPLLDYASCVLTGTSTHPEIVLMLLEHDADPQEVWGVRMTSVWQNNIVSEFGGYYLSVWPLTLQHLVRYGADPNASIDLDEEKSEGSPSKIRRYLDDPEQRWNTSHDEVEFEIEATKLLELLISKGARDEEWHQMSDGTFKQVYPEQSTIQPTSIEQDHAGQPTTSPIGPVQEAQPTIIAQDNHGRLSTTPTEPAQTVQPTIIVQDNHEPPSVAPIRPAQQVQSTGNAHNDHGQPTNMPTESKEASHQETPKASRNLFTRLKKRVSRPAKN